MKHPRRVTRFEYNTQRNQTSPYDEALLDVSWSVSDNSFVDASDNLIPTKCREHDAAGRLTAVVLPAVDDPENPGSVACPRYEYTYDAYGNHVATRDNIRQTYDVDGNAQIYYDHDGIAGDTDEDYDTRVTRFEYDAQGNQTSRQLPLGENDESTDFIETKAYNDLGQLDYEISFEGIVTDYVYDTDLDTYPTVDENGDPVPLDGNPLDPGDAGRLVAVYYFDNATEHANWLSDPLSHTPDESVEYTYDAFGRTRTVVQDPDPPTANDERTTETEYDHEGRTESIVTSEWITTPGGPVLHEGRVNYAYDPVTGDRTRTTSGEEGNHVTDTAYTYDSLGRLTTVTDADDLAVGYEYDLSGNLARTSQPGDVYGNVYTDYIYDELNRLDIQRTWKDTDDDAEYDSAVDQLLAEFDYQLRADGRRESVHEKQYDADDAAIDEAITNWEYDALGRLISESFDFEADGTIDRIDSYEFDLASNRKTKKVDANADDDYNDPGDSETTYVYDVKDRLLSETLDAPGTDDDRYTAYEYGLVDGGVGEPDRHRKTQQTKKTVTDADGNVLETTDYTYNRQGRLAKVETTAVGDTPAFTEDYEYNADGIRVKRTTHRDGDDDGIVDGAGDETTQTLYLIDPQNHTGYAQILEEFDAATQAFLRYTLGHDVVSQNDQANGILFLLYDGHGSTRGLVDAFGNPLTDQIYRYDAYGIRMDESDALTSLLYGGEKTDLTGLQYLRKRYLDPNTGYFNRYDPFAGNIHDPLSLHKLLYAHANPVMGVDPSGQFFSALASAGLRGSLYGAGVGAAIGTLNGVTGYFSGQMTFDQAATTVGKWTLAGLVAGAGIGVGTYSMWTGLGFMGVTSRGMFVAGVTGATSLCTYVAGGYEALLSGWQQRTTSRANWAMTLQADIKSAARKHSLPAELLASVLTCELLDYNAIDWIGDDWVLKKPEGHSMGLAQLRIDNVRKFGIRGWNANTLAYEIRTALMDARESVDILAEVLRLIYDRSDPIRQREGHVYDWQSVSDEDRVWAVKFFAGGKDNVNWRLNCAMKLAGCAEQAYRLVHGSGLYR